MIKSELTTVEILESEILKGSQLFEHIKRLSGKKEPSIAIICDNAPISSKDELIEELKAICPTQVFDKVQPNPRVVDIMNMMDQITIPDCIIGIGGGSTLDSAKAIAMLCANGGNLDDYLGNSPKRKIEKISIPLILLPTTGGTGSEVTKVGVYTATNGRKFTLGSILMQARLAILNASFLLFAPPALCASTGLDALDHALESLWNKNRNEKTIKAAQEAAIEVLVVLEKVYDSAIRIRDTKQTTKQDLNLRRMMLIASCKAGIAFSITGTAAGHSLSFVLSENWHVPHGTACAFTLQGVFKLAITDKDVKQTLIPIAKHFFPEIKDDEGLIEALSHKIKILMKKMMQPENFKAIGVDFKKEDIDKEFCRAFDDPKMWNQVPKATKENIYPILEALC
jgi:alcohol dehydrogenase class IV